MTYGSLRFRLAKLAPNLDLDVLDGWIQDRYQQILDLLDWDRTAIKSTFQTEAEYAVETLSAENGSTTLAGDGTVWVESHMGRMIRIAGRPEFYGFIWISEDEASLERGYEGETGSGLSYRLVRNVYTMPSDVRQVVSIHSFPLGREVKKLTQAELNALDPRRNSYGSPEYFSSYMDSISDPPVLQVEFYPVPVAVEGFVYDAVSEPATPEQPTTSLLPWIRPGALIEGVTASIAAHPVDHGGFGDLGKAQYHETQFAGLVAQMVNIASRRKGATSLQPSNWMVSHQARRWLR